MTLAIKPNEARARAEASFRKEERAKEGAKAMTEYQANSRMIRDKDGAIEGASIGQRGSRQRAGRLNSTSP